MRPRDARAIAFGAATTILVLILSAVLIRNSFASLGLTAAYAAIVFTRPRMLRVFRRLRGSPGLERILQE